MDDAYDGIILGTGHNSLVLQAYLSRSGLRTVALESAALPGGGLRTIENPRLAGFRHNTHAFYLRGIRRMPWFDDLELERHGVATIEPELNVALVLRDGRTLQWWSDLERTEDSFANFSREDARALRRWVEEFRPLVEDILAPEAQSPPLHPRRRRELLGRTPAGRRVLESSARSPLDFVMEEFENDTVRAGLLLFNGLREVDLRLSGFGHAIPALLASPQRAEMCIGGSGALARGLVADILEHGGEIRYATRARAIRLEGGRAAGVELDSGERIRARGFVASGLNPQQTFLELLAPDAVPEAVRARARGFRYNLLAPLFTLNLALSEPPRYRAADRCPELDDALMVILGLEDTDQFRAIIEAHEKGRVPPTVAWGSCPTRFDPGQAPEGKHTAFLWEKVPFALDGDPATWERERDAHAAQLLRFWNDYAPNLRDCVLDQFSATPADTERDLPNMWSGDLLVGSFADNQVGYSRPFGGAGRYRTPLEGLYLCGASTHPGGNVTGLCGYNAASVVAADLGLEAWWKPIDFEAHLEEKGK